MRHAVLFTVAIAALLGSCSGDTPTSPITAAPAQQVALAVGQWSSEESVCLTVTQQESSLFSGCGRGRFPTPAIRSDGTFDIDGTFRFEAGPTLDTPAAPAHFSGRINGTTLNLTVQQTGTSAPPESFALKFAGEGTCSPLCR